MRRPLLTLCVLLVLLTAALRLFFRPPSPTAESDRDEAAVPSISTAAPVPPVTAPAALAHDFRADFVALLGPFETREDGDPFLREKRAAAFQAQIERVETSQIAAAYQAAAEIQATHPTEAAADLRDRLFYRWRELDPGALNVIEPAAENRSLAAEIIALSDTDPVAAARRALEQLPPGQQQTNILIGIVQRLAALDAPAARAWVNEFPAGGLRDRALEQLRRTEGRGKGRENVQ